MPTNTSEGIGLLEQVESTVFRRVRQLPYGLEGVRQGVLAEMRLNGAGSIVRAEGRGRVEFRDDPREIPMGSEDQSLSSVDDPDTSIPIVFLGGDPGPSEALSPTPGPAAPSRIQDALAMLRLMGAGCPLLCIPLLTLLYEHWSGIVSTTTVFVLLVAIDARIEAQASLKDLRSVKQLLGIIAALLLLAGLLTAVFSTYSLWGLLLFRAPSSDPLPAEASDDVPQNVAAVASGFFINAWLVITTGFLVKMVVMVAKAVLLIGARNLQPTRKGRLLAAIEEVGTVYFQGVPLLIWGRFFFQGHYPFCLAAVNMALYLYYKARQIVHQGKMTYHVLHACASAHPPYGVYADESEVIENGQHNECSICREPMAQSIIKLSCDHFFCEDCIVSWLDRKKECPLCRHAVGEYPDQPSVTLRTNGSTNVWCWWF